MSMWIDNALTPSYLQTQTAMQRDDGRPIYMINLLQFRDRAEYADGRSSELSGRHAYAIYGRAMIRLTEDAGGRLVFAGDVRGLFIGLGDIKWDQVGIMMFPSFRAMTAIIESKAYADIHVHRVAGLAGQMLIETVDPIG